MHLRSLPSDEFCSRGRLRERKMTGTLGPGAGSTLRTITNNLGSNRPGAQPTEGATGSGAVSREARGPRPGVRTPLDPTQQGAEHASSTAPSAGEPDPRPHPAICVWEGGSMQPLCLEAWPLFTWSFGCCSPGWPLAAQQLHAHSSLRCTFSTGSEPPTSCALVGCVPRPGGTWRVD